MFKMELQFIRMLTLTQTGFKALWPTIKFELKQKPKFKDLSRNNNNNKISSIFKVFYLLNVIFSKFKRLDLFGHGLSKH